MIIAMSGAGGTGKTTLAQHLAQELHLPFYGSVSRIVFQRYQLTEADQRLMTMEELYQLQAEIFEEKVKQDREVFGNGVGGVFDRTPVDQLAYLLYRADTSIDQERFMAYLRACQDLMRNYHITFRMPFYLFNSEDGFREASYGYLRHYHYLLQGLWDEFKPLPNPTIVSIDLDDRVEECVRKMRDIGYLG